MSKLWGTSCTDLWIHGSPAWRERRSPDWSSCWRRRWEAERQQRNVEEVQQVKVPNEFTILGWWYSTDLVCLMFVLVLRSGLGVPLNIQVPSIQLDDVPVLDVREDLCYGFISVTLRRGFISEWRATAIFFIMSSNSRLLFASITELFTSQFTPLEGTTQCTFRSK